MQRKTIPILDLVANYRKSRKTILRAIDEVLLSGKCILGPKVTEFEQAAAAYLGTPHAIGVNSGTDALKIALKALDIGPGDEVVTTPFTFLSTAETIIEVGAIPVFADINPATFNIDPLLIKKCITSKTKAVLIVHLFGLPCQMDEIIELCSANNLFLIEDVAQAFGSKYKDKYTGTFGSIACYSFYPTKNLFTYGDSGMITTDDMAISNTCKLLRNHGIKQNYEGDFFGYNSRLDSMHAAILLSLLPNVELWNSQRRALASNYTKHLSTVQDIILPAEEKHSMHVYNQYTIRIKNNRRDALKQHLVQEGISTNIYYPKPLHLTKPFSFLKHKPGDFPHSEQAAADALSLPLWPGMPATFTRRIITAIKMFCR